MIYLIDPYGNINTGHFWKVTTDFYKALNALKLPFLFMSPTPNAKILTATGLSSDYCIGTEQVPTILNERQDYFEKFLQELNGSMVKNVVIFTWLPSNTVQFYENFFSRITNINVATFGISTLKSSSVLNYDENYSFELEEIFDRYNCCKVLWVWHEPNSKNIFGKKTRRLPEFHSNKNFLEHSMKVDSSIQLNFYGGLNSLRGLGEILLIAFFNPRLSIKIKGYGFSKFKVWRPIKSKIFRYSKWQEKPPLAIFIALISFLISTLRFLPNVEFDSKPFRNEDEFLQAIGSSSFLFIGCKLPHSSGVALAALAAGVPVIWFGEKGEAVRTLTLSSPKGQIDYLDIFIVGRITKILKEYEYKRPKPFFTWDMLLDEIKYLEQYL